MTLLIAGETYALVAIANDEPAHADIVAGAMAAGVVAILAAAAQGVRTVPQGRLSAEYEKRSDSSGKL